MSSLDDDMFIGGDRGETLSMTLEEIDLAIAAADAPVSSPRGINTYVRSTTSPRAGSDMIGSSSSLPKHGDQSGRSSLRRLGSGEHMHRTTRNLTSTMPPPLAPVRAASAERARKAVPVLAGNAALRDRDRVVSLPRGMRNELNIPEEFEDDMRQEEEDSIGGAPCTAPMSPGRARAGQGGKHCGRITVYCVAEAFERELLESELQKFQSDATILMYPDVVYFKTRYSASGIGHGDVFILDYGVVCLWNLSVVQEGNLLDLLSPCMRKPMKKTDTRQVEELSYHYSAHEPPHIKNDMITINRWQSNDHEVKLSISLALAQSCKLAEYEERIGLLVEEVRILPEDMAEYGEVRMSRRQVAMLMGKVFLQKSQVNLLSSVLDTPEFFWEQDVPDSCQMLYEKVCEYRELEGRVELVNARFEIMQRMLNIWSEHSQVTYIARLDIVVAVLIVIEVIIAAFEVYGLIEFHRQK